MARPPLRRALTLALGVLFLALRATCGGAAVKKQQDAGAADDLTKKEAQKFIAEATSQYSAYRSLKVNFTLKGKVNDEELYYEGELSASGDDLRIHLKDAVFLSPLLTLDIGKERVKLKDHARNKTESVPRSEYQWVDLFGRAFPLRFFEPLMRGFLPGDATNKESSFAKTSGGEILVKTSNDSYEAAMYFQGSSLRKIFYRDKLRGEILVFHLANFFNKRAYPQILKIEHSRTNDHLTLSFRGLRVTGEIPAAAKP